MKHLSIIFRPNTKDLNEVDYQLIWSRLLVSEGNEIHFPKFGFENHEVPYPGTEGHYEVCAEFDRRTDTEFEFVGLEVIFEPSQCMFGHNILPGSDMDTSRRLAFYLLLKVLNADLGDDPFVDLFNQHQAEVRYTGMAFYVPYADHNAGSVALQALVSHVNAIDNDQHWVTPVSYFQLTCEGTLNDMRWSMHSRTGLSIRLFVTNNPLGEKFADPVTTSLSEHFLEYARSVLVIEVDLGCVWWGFHELADPLVWDLPSIDVYEIVCCEVKKALRLDAVDNIGITSKPKFPKSIMSKTFNRKTGAAYFRKLQ